MQGKQIQDFLIIVGDEETLYKPVEGGKICAVEDNYGDHGIAWAVRFDSNGNEIDRHNLKYVAAVTWAK